jgi:hypothetical protein
MHVDSESVIILKEILVGNEFLCAFGAAHIWCAG